MKAMISTAESSMTGSQEQFQIDLTGGKTAARLLDSFQSIAVRSACTLYFQTELSPSAMLAKQHSYFTHFFPLISLVAIPFPLRLCSATAHLMPPRQMTVSTFDILSHYASLPQRSQAFRRSNRATHISVRGAADLRPCSRALQSHRQTA